MGSHHFVKVLGNDLMADATDLRGLLVQFGEWKPEDDAKLGALHQLLMGEHTNQKVLLFTQFADTVRYLDSQLKARGVTSLAAVTGDTAEPTRMAWRFSPKSNKKEDRVEPDKELRVLVATDVLSEGQNLQDCAIVVNYDLPWAIIRLIQRAGRVDRIGQQAEDILCYSFLPADGIERLIRLRARVRSRLHENAEVVGTDEAFFEDEDEQTVLDLYNEKAGILDGDDETDVDLSSYAYQIWKNATTADPSLKKIVEDMPSVVYSSRTYERKPERPDGVLVYMRTTQGHDALAWMDRDGGSVTESQFEILRTAECPPDTPALARHESHHDLVRRAAELIAREEKQVGGQLGHPSGARFRTYERLKRHAEDVENTLFDTEPLRRAIDDIYRYTLRQTATDTLNRQLRSGILDAALAEMVITLRDEGRLCIVHEEDERQEPRIICSMGLIVERSERKHHPETMSDFRKVLERVAKHASERYFILKSIIVDNLYGVDIMEEAVEICKLRLFLKLVAQLESYDQIELLPDIDFNIRAGNTLVGFASLKEVKRALGADMLKKLALPDIEVRAEIADRAFRKFREMQIDHDMDAGTLADAKLDLRERLDGLRAELDRYLADEHGVKIDDEEANERWRDSHQPFHWFVEFHGIMHGGGFNVILGNPPYLETREVSYSTRFFTTTDSGAIHAMCTERSLALCKKDGCVSMIVPMALVSTQRMTALQNMLERDRDCWYSNFAWRPGKLFDTVNRALTIFVAVKPKDNNATFSTAYLKWNSDSRSYLIPSLRYAGCPRNRRVFWVPKLGHHLEISIL